MTTEQMDWLDDERAGRHTTDERRKAAAALKPEVLYGIPSREQMVAARVRAGRRGVLVLPEGVEGVWETPVIQSATPVPEVAADEPEHVNPEDYVTMAEEPPEHRDRRQWLDGYLYGFREGFERAGWRRP